ncbi:HEAT repeat domain-containing protein [Leptolyngbya sp. AN02str]|uniref:HEAT repeat domain-containing protein n=1 Tax=Leptolyngbya sp. AN02str TaxID=3423363 RepID=UPI003D3109CA
MNQHSDVTVSATQLAELISQAIASARMEDWYSVVQSLHQIVGSFNVTDAKAESSNVLADQDWVILDLALRVLDDGDFQERWEVSRIFAALGEAFAEQMPCLTEPLIARLQNADADPELRWFAARILGELRHPTVLAALLQVIRESPRDELIEAAVTALSNYGAIAIAELAQLLHHPSTRLLATKTLAQIRSGDVVDPLLSVVSDADPSVRAAALSALSNFEDPRVVPLLMDALHDPSSRVRCTAVTDLSFWPDAVSHADLAGLIQPLLNDPDTTVCQQAAIALGRVGTTHAVKALQRALSLPYLALSVHVTVIRALGWIDTAAALQALSEYAAQPDTLPVEVLLELIAALGRVRKPSLTPDAAHCLINLLPKAATLPQPILIQQTIAQELGQLGEPVALEALLTLAAHPSMTLKLHALAALKKLDAASAYERLQSLVSDPAQPITVQQELAIAIQEWG